MEAAADIEQTEKWQYYCGGCHLSESKLKQLGDLISSLEQGFLRIWGQKSIGIAIYTKSPEKERFCTKNAANQQSNLTAARY